VRTSLKGVFQGLERGVHRVLEAPLILVIEDDQQIQVLIEEALREGGFETAVTASGEEAITLLKTNDKFRAIVTDINVSGRHDGWEIARVARELNPKLPVVYMSGSHAEDWSSKGVPDSIMLAKPFAPMQLITAVAQLLNAVPPSA
jgi:CheY-like chemotaxis protein